MILLKQSTAAIDRLGPFVDDTDFKTKETGLSIGQSDIQISKAGGAYAQTSESSPTTSHDSGGYYQIPLTATDTGTLGRLRVKLSVSGALDVWADYLVVPAAVFDAIVNGTGNGIRADVLAWIGTALSESSSGRQAGNLDTFLDNADAATAKTLDDVGSGGGGGGLTALASGTAQSSSSSTLVLAASSTFADDELNGNVINITGGTGAGQSRLITDYVNSTDTATIKPNWTTNPDATSTYEVVQGSVKITDSTLTSATFDASTAFPLASADSGATEVARTGADSDTLKTLSDQIDGVSASSIAAAVWDRLTSALTTAGSVGALVVSKLNLISGSTTQQVNSAVASGSVIPSNFQDGGSIKKGRRYINSEGDSLWTITKTGVDLSGETIKYQFYPTGGTDFDATSFIDETISYDSGTTTSTIIVDLLATFTDHANMEVSDPTFPDNPGQAETLSAGKLVAAACVSGNLVDLGYVYLHVEDLDVPSC